MARFNTSGLSNPPDKAYRFGDFLGVDYFNVKSKVSPQRATDMSNLIHKDGVNQKRPGFNQVGHLYYGAINGKYMSCQINGIWFLKSNNNEVALVHAGTHFFIYKDANFENNPEEIIPTAYDESLNYKLKNIKDERSFGVIRGNRIYILCGVYLVGGFWDDKFELRLVENDKDTYVPTTTIGITELNANLDTRTILDEPNMLSSRRINKVIGNNDYLLLNSYGPHDWHPNPEDQSENVYDNATNKYGYIITKEFNPEEELENDAAIINNGTLQIVINADEDLYILQCSTSSNQSLSFSEFDYNEENDVSNLIRFCFDKSKEKATKLYNQIRALSIAVYRMEEETNIKITVDVKIAFKNEIDNRKIRVSECIIFDGNPSTYVLDAPVAKDSLIYLNGIELEKDMYSLYTSVDSTISKITFIKGLPKPLIEGQSNYEIMFTTANESEADKINGCRFGMIFEYNDLQHLFVSGNPSYPNYDYHTSDRYQNTTQNFSTSEYEDLTYFGSSSFYMLGSATHPIVGYSLLSDDTIAIHKEFNPNEPNLYIRRPTIVTIVDVLGNEYKKIEYTQTSATISEGALNNNTIANLFNDNLFLSRNGIFGIQLSENIKTDERYAVERSTLVNNKLMKEDLEDSTAIVFENRYYLALKNGRIYIADSRFRTRVANDLLDTLSYEFWIWEDVPVNVWFVKNNLLGFGTRDGQICLFNDVNQFYDQTYFMYSEGSIKQKSETEFIISNSVEIENNDKIYFEEGIEKLLLKENEIKSNGDYEYTTDLDNFWSNISPYDKQEVLVEIEQNSDLEIVNNIENYDQSFATIDNKFGCKSSNNKKYRYLKITLHFNDLVAEESYENKDCELLIDIENYTFDDLLSPKESEENKNKHVGKIKKWAIKKEDVALIEKYLKKITINVDSSQVYIGFSEENVSVSDYNYISETLSCILEINSIENYIFKLKNNETNEYLNDSKIVAISKKEHLVDVNKIYELDDIRYITFKGNTFTNENDEIVDQRFIQNGSIKDFKVIHEENVKCYWKVPSTDLGVPYYLKKGFGITLTPEIYINSDVDVSYTTRKLFGLVETIDLNTDGENFIDFENFEIKKFTIHTNKFDIAYNKRIIINDFNYIQFILSSNNRNNFGVKELILHYRVTRKAKGVR